MLIYLTSTAVPARKNYENQLANVCQGDEQTKTPIKISFVNLAASIKVQTTTTLKVYDLKEKLLEHRSASISFAYYLFCLHISQNDRSSKSIYLHILDCSVIAQYC
jgi:hypothetical protein